MWEEGEAERESGSKVEKLWAKYALPFAVYYTIDMYVDMCVR